MQPDRQRRPTQALRHAGPAGISPAPGPVSDTGQEGEHEVELPLNRQLVRQGVACCATWCAGGATHQRTKFGCGLMSWCTAWRRWRNERRCTASQHAPPHRPRRRPRAGADTTAAPRHAGRRRRPLVAPAGFRIAAPSEVPAGAALVGREVLSLWPAEGYRNRGPPQPGRRILACGAVCPRVGRDALRVTARRRRRRLARRARPVAGCSFARWCGFPSA